MSEDILKDAESFFFKGNDIGILVIHGFTGTTQSMYLVGQDLAKEGFTVLAPRLTGHGITPEAMKEASYEDWFEDVEEALVELKQHASQIFMMGLSMGGALTCYLAEQHEDILGIIPINAAIDMPDFADFYQQNLKNGIEFVDGIGSDIKANDVTELAYAKTPVKSMGDLLALMDIVRENLPKICCPTLIFSSLVDHVVPPENSQMIFDNISSRDKTLIPLPNSYHVATLDNDRFLIVKESVHFINRYKV